MGKESLKIVSGNANLDDTLEAWRKKIVKAQQFGGIVVFDMGNVAYNWKEKWSNDNFNVDLILNSNVCRDPAQFIKFVKTDENFDRENVNPGQYEFDKNAKFSVALIVDGSTVNYEDAKANLPHQDYNIFTIT